MSPLPPFSLRPLLSLLLGLAGMGIHPVAAQSPVINHQGTIGISGAPFTGTGQFKFLIYADEDDTQLNGGDIARWSNASTAPATTTEPVTAVSVPVNQGRFSLGLGDPSIAGMAALPPQLRVDGQQRLRIRTWFRPGTSGSFQLMYPDLPIGAAAAALTTPRFVDARASATGANASATGNNASATGTAAFAAGNNTSASGTASIAIGTGSSAANTGAAAIGTGSSANGTGAVAIGKNASAGGTGAIAIGPGASAANSGAIAIGKNATASPANSTALGADTQPISYAETALGGRAAPYTPLSTSAWSLSDRLFVIGSGNPNDPMAATNALTILKNGNTGIRTTTPEARLHVLAGNDETRTTLDPTTGSSGGQSFALRLRTSTTSATLANGFGTGMRFHLHDNDATTDAAFIGTARDGTADTHNSFVFHTANGGAPSEKMRLDRFGNLTISGTLIETSDRNVKHVGPPADPAGILDKVRALPLYQWKYKGDDRPHLGPVAQDFHAAFGLGGDDRRIAVLDADGVAMAATQALAARCRALDATAATTTGAADALSEKLHALTTRIEALESSAQP